MISGTEIDVYGNCRVGVNFAVSLFFMQEISLAMFRKRQTMRTYANFKKYERMLLTVIAKTSRCYHRKEHSL